MGICIKVYGRNRLPAMESHGNKRDSIDNIVNDTVIMRSGDLW